jgi:hypothetical protein
MDCIDCHNHSPPSLAAQIGGQGHQDGLIARAHIRSKAVAVLSESYASNEEALKAIDALGQGYANGSGLLFSPFAGPAKVALAVDAIKTIYSTTVFPEMKLDWKVNPNNEKHTPSLGCYRCHDGEHVLAGTSGEGEVTVSVECNTCHTVPITGRGMEMLFEAPVVIGAAPDSHKDYSWTVEHRSVTEDQKLECYQCHGQGFCNNGACHNLSHPADMYTMRRVSKNRRPGCYLPQDLLCIRCHPGRNQKPHKNDESDDRNNSRATVSTVPDPALLSCWVLRSSWQL